MNQTTDTTKRATVQQRLLRLHRGTASAEHSRYDWGAVRRRACGRDRTL